MALWVTCQTTWLTQRIVVFLKGTAARYQAIRACQENAHGKRVKWCARVDGHRSLLAMCTLSHHLHGQEKQSQCRAVSCSRASTKGPLATKVRPCEKVGARTATGRLKREHAHMNREDSALCLGKLNEAVPFETDIKECFQGRSCE